MQLEIRNKVEGRTVLFFTRSMGVIWDYVVFTTVGLAFLGAHGRLDFFQNSTLQPPPPKIKHRVVAP